MMTMSKALGAAQAKTYYGSQYTNGRESYYTERDTVDGEWSGRLADEYGLEGAVEKEQFERLIDGQDPHTGEQLVRHVAAKEYENEFGETVKSSEHRAGWDATFSAPKTVSIAALVGKDERIREAHREAVDVALKALEKYTQARLGGNRQSPMTGKLIAAKFEHDSARPDKETGYAAPQLHTHTIIFNLTRTEDGETKPVQPIELYRSQQYATAIYRAKLAERLQDLGYEVEVDRRTGAPEIKGFSAEYVAANSPRREEVKREAKEIQQAFAEAGIAVREGAGLNQAAAKRQRESKDFDRVEMQRRHAEVDAQHNYQAVRITETAREGGTVARAPEEIERRAQEAVTFARDHAMEREAVADVRKVTADALRRGLALTSYDAVRQELEARELRGEFIGITREHEPKQTTTREMLNLERGNVTRILAEQGKAEPFSAGQEEARRLTTESAVQATWLNDSQRAAVETVLTSRDRIIGLQGGAGTGKTTTLAVLKAAVEQSGYEVKGLAPTTKAVKQLNESGIETVTLQKFLRSYRHNANASDNQKTLHVLDESSLASTRNINSFFERVGPADKILLVGDVRQHQAIEAGSPFEQFQKHGMMTARLTEIVRQKDESLKQVVEQLSAKEVRAAVTKLQVQGRVIEVPDDPKSERPEEARLEAIAQEYVRAPEGTLVISPANKERVAINAMVHRELQEKGVVGKTDHTTNVYVNRQDMTGAERTFAGAYAPNEDIIHYNSTSRVYGVSAGEYGSVTASDRTRNTITVRLESGRTITYNPQRLSGVNVYKEAERKFSEGDRIQFRAPLAEQKVANGELGTITKIEGTQFTVALEGERRATFDAKNFRHIDHGYAVTSYLSQGETVERVIINADTKQSDAVLNQRMSYVAVSRARMDAKIYTNSQAELGEALDRQVDKQMALEAVSRQNEKSAEGSTHEKEQQGKERMWMPVTEQDPCPICRKPDYCSVVVTAESSAEAHRSGDEGDKERHVAIFCRRVESDRPGRGGWYHELPEGEDASRYEGVQKVEQNEVAPVERRDAVFKRMNELLSLSDRDRKNLNERGLDDGTITKYDYPSVPTRKEAASVVKQLLKEGYDLTNVPGFHRPDSDKNEWRMNVSQWHQGFMVNALDIDGRIQGQQIRRAEVKPIVDRETGKVKVDAETEEPKMEPRYVWFSSANKPATSKTEAVIRHDGASSGCPVHYRNPEIMRATGEAILTEGVLKADVIAHYSDRGVVGIAGVGNYPKDLGQELREKAGVNRVLIAYDADAVRKPQVQLHLDGLREVLTQAGLEVQVGKWDESQGKGLDDYLKNRLGRDFGHTEQADRAERQRETLREIGWTEGKNTERSLGTEEAVNEQDAGAVEREVTRAAAVAEYEKRLQEIERRTALGDELFDRWQVQHYTARADETQEQRRTRRYEVTDESTGLKREISIHDIEQRALAVSQRVTESQAAAADRSLTARERDELRQAAYVVEINRHQETIAAVSRAHSEELRYYEKKLTEAIGAHNRSAPVANEVTQLYRTEGRDVPTPIITPEKLDELHERAVKRRDVAQLGKLEEIRRELPAEFSDVTRDDHTAGRLEGQMLSGRISLSVAEKRVEDFERTNYFRRWEVEGYQWSQFAVERQLQRAEANLAFHETRAASHLEKTRFKLSNLPHLFERGENRQKAEAEAVEAARAQFDVTRLQMIREQVVRLTEAERTRLNEGARHERAFVEALSAVAEGERERRASIGIGEAAPVLTKNEMRRMEANAGLLRDPELLHRFERLNDEQSAKLSPEKAQTEISQAAARAFAREQVAGISLTESIERLEAFETRRLEVPLLYRDANGERRIGSLREVEPKNFSDRLLQRFTQTAGDRERREAIQLAATERHAQLVRDREQAGAMYVAARDITDRYIERLHAHAPGAETPAPHYTAKEIAQIETHAAKQDEVARAFYQEVVSTAIIEGRVGNSKLEKLNRTQADHTEHQPQVSHKPEQANSHSVEARTPVVLQDHDHRRPDRSRKIEGSNHKQGIGW